MGASASACGDSSGDEDSSPTGGGVESEGSQEDGGGEEGHADSGGNIEDLPHAFPDALVISSPTAARSTSSRDLGDTDPSQGYWEKRAFFEQLAQGCSGVF